MPRKETILNVFVASPSDVIEERKALESIITELNRTWSKSLNLRLDLIKWETDVYPSFGKYPQDAINQQVNDQYDIFIAIFWGKVGTPTPNSDSGSIEELERAMQKHARLPKSVDIMVYFKDQAISPSKMDFVQLQKLQNLKVHLGDKGGLYWTFDSTEDFEALLRGHLSRVAQKWSESMVKEPESISEPVIVPELASSLEENEVLDDETEYGLLDYQEIFEERLSEMLASLYCITEATERIGKQFVKRTDELCSLQDQSGRVDAKQAKKVIKFTCDDMEKYADVLEYQRQISTSAREEVFDVLSKALALMVDFKEQVPFANLNDLEESLLAMRDGANTSNETLSDFRTMIASLPRLTSTLNKAKRRVVKALDEYFEEIQATAGSAQNIMDIIMELKCNGNRGGRPCEHAKLMAGSSGEST